MSLTRDDYARAVDGAARDLEALGGDLVSAYVYGSTARGEMRPGSSDIDVAVFLRDRAWESRDTYTRTLEALQQMARGLIGAGIPWDGDCYVSEEETRYMPLPWQHQFRSSRDTRLIAGRSIVPDLDEPLPFARSTHEVFYLFAAPAAGYLAVEELTTQQCAEVGGFLKMIRTYVPQGACAAAGVPTVMRDAPTVLARLFPGLDLSIIAALGEIQHREAPPPSAEAKALLKRALVLIEDLDRGLAALPAPAPGAA